MLLWIRVKWMVSYAWFTQMNTLFPYARTGSSPYLMSDTVIWLLVPFDILRDRMLPSSNIAERRMASISAVQCICTDSASVEKSKFVTHTSNTGISKRQDFVQTRSYSFIPNLICINHDDVMAWKHFRTDCHFVRGFPSRGDCNADLWCCVCCRWCCFNDIEQTVQLQVAHK